MKIEKGTIIRCKNEKYKVISKIGSGGEGEVWKVKGRFGKKYAFKLITDKNAVKRKKREENLKALKNKHFKYERSLKSKKFTIALPIEIYEENNDFGYIMNLCKGKSINDMLFKKGDIDKMSTRKRIKLIKRIAKAASWFQENGLCHHDFSHKNFIYRKRGKRVYVIDCDNATEAHNTNNTTVNGTGFYVPPEIAFKKATGSVNSDSYALAVLFFIIMVGNKCDSPYHGTILFKKCAGCLPADMLEAADMSINENLGYDWLTFIFDDDDKNKLFPDFFKNKAESKEKKAIIKRWKKVPSWMKSFFKRAFKNPLNEVARSKRPSAKDWVEGRKAQKRFEKKEKSILKHSMYTSMYASTYTSKNTFSSNDKGKKVVVRISGSCIISPESTNNAISTTFGKVFFLLGGYYFKSTTPYILIYEKGGTKGRINFNEMIQLETGMVIYLPTRMSEKIEIKIVKT